MSTEKDIVLPSGRVTVMSGSPYSAVSVENVENVRCFCA